MLILYHTTQISSAVSLRILCYVRRTCHDHLMFLIHLSLRVRTKHKHSELSTTPFTVTLVCS